MNSRKLRITNAVIIAAICIFIAGGWFLVKPNVYNNLIMRKDVIEPKQVASYEDTGTGYKFHTVDLGSTSNSLMFYTNHQEVYVYADDTLIYSCEKINSIFSNSTGSVNNIVPIPYGTRYLLVIIKPVYEEVRQKSVEFYYGNGTYMYHSIMHNSLLEMFICLIVLAMGICLMIYYYMLGTRNDKARDVLYLGSFTLILGIWILGETNGAKLLFTNRPLASYAAFTCVMAFPIPFMYFTRFFMQMKDKVFHLIIMIIDVTFFIVLQAMQLTGYRDLRQNSMFCQMPIFISFIYFSFAIMCNLKKKEMRNRTILNIIGGIVLIAFLTLDLRTYYVDRENANTMGKYGFIFYIALLGIETAKGAKSRLDEERKNNLYKEMAVMDMLTECFNRNALNEDVKNTVNARGCYALNFDLNNLKVCNDNLGHKEGDKYLMGSAKLICTIFGKYGKVYRTGGDEFCVITNPIELSKVEDLISRMRTEKDRFYQAPEGYNLGIAIGYARYDALEDRNLFDTIERADEMMYEDKKRMKREFRQSGSESIKQEINDSETEN